MNKWKIFLISALVLLISNSSLMASEGHKPYNGSKAFERMKQLVGEWEGTMDMGQGPQKVTARYKLTAADSALLETVFEGSPHEMVSVYHDNRDRALTMVHYCAEHNQPRLVLTHMTDDALSLELSKDSDIDVTREHHIHAATIQFNGKDKMIQRWTGFENGKKKQEVIIDYKRVQ